MPTERSIVLYHYLSFGARCCLVWSAERLAKRDASSSRNVWLSWTTSFVALSSFLASEVFKSCRTEFRENHEAASCTKSKVAEIWCAFCHQCSTKTSYQTVELYQFSDHTQLALFWRTVFRSWTCCESPFVLISKLCLSARTSGILGQAIRRSVCFRWTSAAAKCRPQTTGREAKQNDKSRFVQLLPHAPDIFCSKTKRSYVQKKQRLTAQVDNPARIWWLSRFYSTNDFGVKPILLASKQVVMVMVNHPTKNWLFHDDMAESTRFRLPKLFLPLHDGLLTFGEVRGCLQSTRATNSSKTNKFLVYGTPLIGLLQMLRRDPNPYPLTLTAWLKRTSSCWPFTSVRRRSFCSKSCSSLLPKRCSKPSSKTQKKCATLKQQPTNVIISL